jgi:hypothetical protein
LARKKDTGAGVVKFSAVFALDTLHRDAKLGVDIGEKIRQGSLAQGKSPNIMRKIIKNNKVILVTRNTGNRGGPYITMY